MERCVLRVCWKGRKVNKLQTQSSAIYSSDTSSLILSHVSKTKWFEMFVPLRTDRRPSVRSISKQSFTQLIRWKLDQEEARASQFMWDCKTLLCIVSELNIETMARLVGSNINITRKISIRDVQNWWLQGRKVAEITVIMTWKVSPQASNYSCPIWSPWRNLKL